MVAKRLIRDSESGDETWEDNSGVESTIFAEERVERTMADSGR